VRKTAAPAEPVRPLGRHRKRRLRTLSPARRYVEAALALGEHVDELVLFSLAPWPAPKRSRDQIVDELEELLADLSDVEDASRRAWLEAQTQALLTVAGEEDLSLEEEVEACFGVEARPLDEAELTAAHELLDEALPGAGTLASRCQGWLAENEVRGDKVVPALRAVAETLRQRTREFVGLPNGEEIEVEVVTNERWLAFSRYLGGLRSRVSYNADLPLSTVDIAHLVAHEAYPGHHTEDAWKDVDLVQGQARVEFSIFTSVGVQPVLAEGIAQLGAELLADEESHETVAEALGGGYDAALGFRVAQARRVLADLSVNLALLHDRGVGHEELVEYAQEWSLQPRARAEKSVQGVATRPFRGSVFCYTEGLRLCRDFAGEDPARFKRLLTEQLALPDLT
jgi:hypothetical protein